jgi:hypothetical protein
MGKSITRSSNIRSKQIVFRASVLAGLAGLVGGLIIFHSSNGAVTFTFATGAAISVALLAAAAFSVMLRPKARIEAAFDFGSAPTIPHRPTSLFEYEVAGLIHQLTGNRTQVVDDSEESNIDIKVYDPEGHLVGIVQCKDLPNHKITHPAFIRDLNTMRNNHQVKTAYLVSKGRFSEESQKLAEQLDIKLIDGIALVKLRKQAA